jgi:hypothetical protein
MKDVRIGQKVRLLRLAAVMTGAKSKHGRQNLLGYECDKLSEEADSDDENKDSKSKLYLKSKSEQKRRG